MVRVRGEANLAEGFPCGGGRLGRGPSRGAQRNLDVLGRGEQADEAVTWSTRATPWPGPATPVSRMPSM